MKRVLMLLGLTGSTTSFMKGVPLPQLQESDDSWIDRDGHIHIRIHIRMYTYFKLNLRKKIRGKEIFDIRGGFEALSAAKTQVQEGEKSNDK